MAKPLNRIIHNGIECKVCPKCKVPVPVTNYVTRFRSGKTHLDTYCKDCSNKKNRDAYKAKTILLSPEKRLEIQRNTIKHINEINKARYENKKEEHPTKDTPPTKELKTMS